MAADEDKENKRGNSVSFSFPSILLYQLAEHFLFQVVEARTEDPEH